MQKIPFLSFEHMNRQIKPEIMDAFEDFFDKGWYILGQEVKAFEAAYAAFNQTGYAVGVSNGLDALHIALRTLQIGVGDEVIVPSNTYIATLLAVSYVGAIPVPVEPDRLTYNLSPTAVVEAITPKTKAIIPVHLYGQACNMTALAQIAQENSLNIIEDNAQAHCATWDGKLTGSWGLVNATSFYPGKNLGALGDAGAITTNSEALAQKASVLRNYGSHRKYYNEEIGYNMRLDECQAAFLSVKLKYILNWTVERRKIAALYNEALSGVGDIVLPFVHKKATHSYHLYVIRTKKRDRLQAYLTQHGIGTLIHYPVPPHMQQAYQSLGYKRGDFPIAEELADTCLSLPLWPGMTDTEVLRVSEVIKSFFA